MAGLLHGSPAPAEERLAGDTRFCLDCLDEIHNAGIAEPAAPDNIPRGLDELANLLAAQSAPNILCTHQDTDALKNDWQEFLNCAAACPSGSDMLERHTREALTARVFSGMTELLDFYLPMTIMCLMRFYMALTFSPTRIPFDADLFRWVILGKQ